MALYTRRSQRWSFILSYVAFPECCRLWSYVRRAQYPEEISLRLDDGARAFRECTDGIACRQWLRCSLTLPTCLEAEMVYARGSHGTEC